MTDLCERCAYYGYDEEAEEYVCEISMDEDDYARYISSGGRVCPYYLLGDEYKVVRHQM